MVQRKDQANGSASNTILSDFVKVIPQLLWFGLVAVLLYIAWPRIIEAFDRGEISEISTTSIKLIQRQLPKVIGLDKQPLTKAEREQLLVRFRKVAANAPGTTVLWVDNEHPYRNAGARRVLTSLGIGVDVARSTGEARRYLEEEPYEILITDLDRPGQPTAPCYSGSPLPASAGCDLLLKIGNGEIKPIGGNPRMIVYTHDINPTLGMPPVAEATAVTAAQFFHLIINLVDQRKIEP